MTHRFTRASLTRAGRPLSRPADLLTRRRRSSRAVHRGRVSYCPQRAWLANASLRDNILFGAPFDGSRYDAVLDACALRADLELLPGA